VLLWEPLLQLTARLQQLMLKAVVGRCSTNLHREFLVVDGKLQLGDLISVVCSLLVRNVSRHTRLKLCEYVVVIDPVNQLRVIGYRVPIPFSQLICSRHTLSQTWLQCSVLYLCEVQQCIN